MRKKNQRLQGTSVRFEKILGAETTQNVVMPLIKEILMALETRLVHENPISAIDTAKKGLQELNNLLEEKQMQDATVLKCTFVDSLSKALETRRAIIENAIKDLQRDLASVKTKAIKARSLENLIYNATKNMPTGYKRIGAGDSVLIERDEPLATKLAEALKKLADGKITKPFEFVACAGSGREVAREVFGNPERLRLYAGYLVCARSGYFDPKKGKHDALIDLETLKKLFDKLGFDFVEPKETLPVVEETLPVESEIVSQISQPSPQKKKKKKEKKILVQKKSVDALEEKRNAYNVLVASIRKIISPMQVAIYEATKNKELYFLSKDQLSALKMAMDSCQEAYALYNRDFYPLVDIIESIMVIVHGYRPEEMKKENAELIEKLKTWAK